ncbi:hypothetical protein Q604_UNBC10251G0002, partial [human gut metagenome]
FTGGLGRVGRDRRAEPGGKYY